MPFGLRRRFAARPSRPIRSPLSLSLERLEARELLSTSAVVGRGYGPYGGWATGLSNFTAAGKLLFFWGKLTGDGQSSDLWRSDGTTAGTFLIAPTAGTESASVGDTLFFHGSDSAHGDELWKTDGTPAGTVMVKDIAPGPQGSGPYGMVNVDGTLFFAAGSDGTYSNELWRSDGTASGTTLVADVNAGQQWNLADLTNVNGRLFFLASPAFGSPGTAGNQLWVSDGTQSGTHFVANQLVVEHRYDYFAGLGNTLFFAEHAQGEDELWRSDGTAAGTFALERFQSSVGESAVTDLVPVGNTLFFVGDDSTHGHQLWKTDGSAAGTTLVTARELGLGGGKPTEWPLLFTGLTPSDLTNVGGTLFFAAADGVHGPELWKSDGTDAGTVMVKDIQPGLAGSAPGWLTNVNGTAYFAADDGTHGRQLWRSNGTGAGTFQLGTVADDGGDLSPVELVNVNGALFFAADTASGNPQVWRSDGTSGGTMPISNEPFQPPQFFRSASLRASELIDRPVLSAASADTLFAINRDDTLFRHDAFGWTPLHDGIVSVSAVTPAAGPKGTVVFAVTVGGGLLRYDDVSGWQAIGAPGTIGQISSGTDVNGRADVFVQTWAGDFTVFSDSSGWSASPIAGRGTVYGMSAGANGRVAVTTNDGSIFEYDPRIGWFRLTDRGFATAGYFGADISLTTDAAGNEVLYARTVGGGLFRHDFGSGWQRLGADGTVTSITAGLDAAGKTTVIAFTTAGDVAEHDDATGWSPVPTPDHLWEAASPTAGGEFFLLDDGSVLARDASGLYTRLSSPGFDP